jgi:restriction endonuclease Mrr
MKKNTIYLQNLDGYEFEKVCEEIFSEIYSGKVERTSYGGDKGRDLIIHSPEGKIFIECKHRPNTSIGRPIIQKLHSIVVSERAIKGIIITTGTFTKQAVSHAKSLKPSIKLIDRSLLFDVALRVGFNLKLKAGKDEIYTLPKTNDRLLEKNLSYYINGFLISFPNEIYENIRINQRYVSLRPAYSIEYRINSVFSTSVGIIHREQGEYIILLDGESAMPLDKNISKFFYHIALEQISKDDLQNVPNVPFMFNLTEIKEKMIERIIDKHTTVISYTGRNNREYDKECIPNKKDILISDISQIYIPHNDIKFNLNNVERNIKLVDNGTIEPYIYYSNLRNCEICGGKISGKGLLCIECGKISHDKEFFDSHGFYCELCGKSICRMCARYSHKYLFFKKALCRKCAKNEFKNGKKIYKYS